MSVVKLLPAYKDYLWGGTQLRDKYNKQCDFDKIAESWELSTHSAGQSIIANGEYEGETLSSYIEKSGKEILGTNANEFENFPVLIKFIDAKQALSIQVHPSDEYALEVEKEYGKTEMWYIVDCEEGASLYFGVNQEVSKEEFRKRIENNTVEEVLNKVPVKKGDVFFIEAGTIHAIGAGILICEIQQNSNTTYRVYDYDRRDDLGNPRELHIDKALEVSKLTPSSEEVKPNGDVLASCKYFTTVKHDIEKSKKMFIDEKSFVSLVILEGEGEVVCCGKSVKFKPADSLFISAGSGDIAIIGNCSIIETRV